MLALTNEVEPVKLDPPIQHYLVLVMQSTGATIDLFLDGIACVGLGCYGPRKSKSYREVHAFVLLYRLVAVALRAWGMNTGVTKAALRVAFRFGSGIEGLRKGPATGPSGIECHFHIMKGGNEGSASQVSHGGAHGLVWCEESLERGGCCDVGRAVHTLLACSL